MSSDTLLIRGFPSQLAPDDRCELLERLGARRVKAGVPAGPLKHAVYAQFPDNVSAHRALQCLHQRELLGRRLRVEYATNGADDVFIEVSSKRKKSDDSRGENVTEKTPVKTSGIKETQQKLNALCSHWSVDYPMNPKLKYKYPPPSVSILTNIANALATVPKFYVQVLHLMNRFNLPAPFGAVTATPPLPENQPTKIVPETEIEEAEMAVSSSEESELETSSGSEQENKIRKRAPKRRLPPTRVVTQKMRLLTPGVSSVKPGATSSISVKDAFEQHSAHLSKKIEIKQVGDVFSQTEEAKQLTDGVNCMLRGIQNMPATTTVLRSNDKAEPSTEVESGGTKDQEEAAPPDLLSVLDAAEPVTGGFGKLEPQPQQEENEGEEGEADEEWGAGEFISSRRLRRGRLSSRDMDKLSVFRSYTAGEPSSRLYIKNIAKATNEKDLHYIYGRYVDWDKEMEKTLFDIRLMKEGRMKGQAFVTLANSEQAEQARTDTNGFELHGRPLVVQFARSAKPKADATTGKGKSTSATKGEKNE